MIKNSLSVSQGFHYSDNLSRTMPILKEKPHWRNTIHTFVVWILQKIFPPYPDFKKVLSSKVILPKQGNALFIRVDQRLGNLLLTTPTIKNFKELFPEFSIDVLVASKFQSALTQLSFIHQVIPFQKKMFFRNPISFFFGILELRKKEYDIVFDCSHSHIYSSTGSMLTFIIGRKYRVGHFHEKANNLYTHSVSSPSESRYEIDQKSTLLSVIHGHEIIPFTKKMETSLGNKPESFEYVSDFYNRHAISNFQQKVMIGINPGARKSSNRASEDFYVALIKEILLQPEAKCLIFWGPNEKEMAFRYEEIFFEESSRVLIAPPTDIEQLACFLNTLAVFITNDTGPMHVSVAKGCATFGIFIDTDSKRWGHHHHPHRCFELQNLSDEEEKKLIKHIAQAAIKLYKRSQ